MGVVYVESARTAFCFAGTSIMNCQIYKFCSDFYQVQANLQYFSFPSIVDASAEHSPSPMLILAATGHSVQVTFDDANVNGHGHTLNNFDMPPPLRPRRGWAVTPTPSAAMPPAVATATIN